MRADRLRHIRELRGLSQRDLAERVGIHPQQLYRIETGQSDTTGSTLTKIAQALEVSLDYLVGLVDEPNEHYNDEAEALSPMERRLIWALRNGYIVEALDSFTTITKTNDQPDIPTNKPAVNS